MKHLLVLLLVGMAWAADFQQLKLVDVKPYQVANMPVIAPNGGMPVLINTGARQFFTLTVLTESMNYSANFPRTKHFDPSKFVVGDSVRARIEKDSIIFATDDGKEIKSRIVRRERATAAPAASN